MHIDTHGAVDTHAVDTAFGTITLTRAGDAIVGCGFHAGFSGSSGAIDRFDAPMPWHFGLDRIPAVHAEAEAQLRAYVEGSLRAFDLPLELGVGGFAAAALEAVREVPYGETASYGEIAAAAGSPRAARAVGSACANTPISLIVPVHRIVRADGSGGGFGGRPELREALLRHEALLSGSSPRGWAVAR